jgi:hypothetical protein
MRRSPPSGVPPTGRGSRVSPFPTPLRLPCALESVLASRRRDVSPISLAVHFHPPSARPHTDRSASGRWRTPQVCYPVLRRSFPDRSPFRVRFTSRPNSPWARPSRLRSHRVCLPVGYPYGMRRSRTGPRTGGCIVPEDSQPDVPARPRARVADSRWGLARRGKKRLVQETVRRESALHRQRI